MPEEITDAGKTGNEEGPKQGTDEAVAAAAAAAKLAKEDSGGGDGGAANGEFTLDPEAFEGDVKILLQRKQFKNVGVALEALVNQEKLVGVDAVAAPVRGETSKFFEANAKAFGVPSEGKGYTIEKVKMPEGMEWDQAYEDAARKFGIENSIPNDLMKKMAEFGIKDRLDRAAAHAGDLKETGDAALEGLRGELRGDYDKTIDLSRQAAKSLGVEGEVMDALDGKMGTAGVIKFFAKLGGMLTEGGIQLGDGIGFTSEEGDAKAQIESLKLDKDFQANINDKKAAGHKEAVAKLEKLHKIAAGENAGG